MSKKLLLTFFKLSDSFRDKSDQRLNFDQVFFIESSN